VKTPGLQPLPTTLAAGDSPAARLQATLNTIPAHMWYSLPSGALAFVSERTADYLGLPENHPLRLGIETGAAWDSHVPLLHPDDREETRRIWANCLRTGEGGDATFRVRNAQGGYRWFIGRAEPLQDTDGCVLYWIGINLDIQERKEAEIYLGEAQRLARTGSWTFDTAGFQYWSPGLFTIHGLDPSTKAPNISEYMALVHPEDRDFVTHEIRAMLANHGRFDFTKRIVRPNGAIRYVRCVGTPAADGPGLVGTGVDVTEQEELTQALRRSEEKFRLLVEGIPALITVHTAEGELEFVNQQVIDYAGMTLEALKGWPNNQAIHPEDLGSVVAAWTDSIQTGRPYEHINRYRRSDGSYRWCCARGLPLRDSEGHIIRWNVVITDIEELKKAQEKIGGQEAELRQILDFTPQLVAVFGPRRERLYINRMALEYFGITSHQWRNSPPAAEIHPDDLERLEAHWNRARLTGVPSDIELRLRGGDSKWRWFLARYNPVRDVEGTVLRWHVSCADIEDRKRAEERLQRENVALREEIDKTSMFEQIVGTSPALMTVLSRVSKVARTDTTVLITGETGTGKELAARAIHRRSGRSSQAFIAVNCAAIPRGLIASELFGHEKGAFAGATERRIGRFELAQGGTIFLDEVGALLPDTQAALLRVLQERELERVGGEETIRVDVRVIAATNRDLTDAASGRRFRRDLFYRLNVFPLHMPSLRERKHDIPALMEYFLHRYASAVGKQFRRADKQTLKHLQSYPWPGNVRELQNVIERSVIVCDGEEFSVDESWLSTGRSVKESDALPGAMATHEKAIIEEALRASGGRVYGPAGAAARLGIPRSTLESRIIALNINKHRFRTTRRS
jgi:PAS domain S-box-containing protein